MAMRFVENRRDPLRHRHASARAETTRVLGHPPPSSRWRAPATVRPRHRNPMCLQYMTSRYFEVTHVFLLTGPRFFHSPARGIEPGYKKKKKGGCLCPWLCQGLLCQLRRATTSKHAPATAALASHLAPSRNRPPPRRGPPYKRVNDVVFTYFL